MAISKLSTEDSSSREGGLLERIRVTVDDMLNTMSATWLDNSANKPPWSPDFKEMNKQP